MLAIGCGMSLIVNTLERQLVRAAAMTSEEIVKRNQGQRARV
jgi:hypothetical protein